MTGRRRLPAVLALGLAGLLGAAAGAAGSDAPRVEVRLAPEVVGLDELATLTIEVASSGFGAPSFEPRFRLENLEAVSGPSTTQSQRWVNGETSASTTLTWRLRPLKVGHAAVRGLEVIVGGSSLPQPDREIEIVTAAPPGRRVPPAAPADPFAEFFGEDDPFGFLRHPARPVAAPRLRLSVAVEPNVAWVGEQVGWRLLLDTQTDISAFNPRDLPDFRGFWVRDVPQPDPLRPDWVDVGGERFGRVTMLRRALFPLRPGRFTLGPASADVVARVAEASWFGPLGRNQQVSLRADPVQVEVRPLPPAPADFTGVVGELRLAAALDRRRLEVGKAATLSIAASGSGNLQGLAPPSLPLPAGLRVFEPRPETSSTVAAGRLVTTVKWNYVVSAERPGTYAVPAVRMVWFDPASATFRTAITEAIRLEVAVPAAVAAAPSAAPGEPATGAPDRPATALSQHAIVAGAAAVVALLAAAGLALRALQARAPARELRRRLADRLAGAEAERSPRLAAAALEEAWRGYAAERWGLGTGLPVARWGETLARAGVPESRGAELIALFDELHYLRFAPELSDVETLREEVFERSRRLLRDLR